MLKLEKLNEKLSYYDRYRDQGEVYYICPHCFHEVFEPHIAGFWRLTPPDYLFTLECPGCEKFSCIE